MWLDLRHFDSLIFLGFSFFLVFSVFVQRLIITRLSISPDFSNCVFTNDTSMSWDRVIQDFDEEEPLAEEEIPTSAVAGADLCSSCSLRYLWNNRK